MSQAASHRFAVQPYSPYSRLLYHADPLFHYSYPQICNTGHPIRLPQNAYIFCFSTNHIDILVPLDVSLHQEPRGTKFVDYIYLN